jgi:hypothetical protein
VIARENTRLLENAERYLVYSIDSFSAQQVRGGATLKKRGGSKISFKKKNTNNFAVVIKQYFLD